MTLFNTLPSLNVVFVEAYKSCGINIDVKNVLAYSREPLLPRYFALGGKKEFIPNMAETINKYQDDPKTIELTEEFPETKLIMEIFKKRDFLTGIVTSNNTNHVKMILDKFKYPYSLFDVYVGNLESKASKPDPEPINVAIEMSGFTGDRKDIAYIGDSLNDALAANNAGVDAFLVDHYDEYKDDKSYIRIKSLKELFK